MATPLTREQQRDLTALQNDFLPFRDHLKDPIRQAEDEGYGFAKQGWLVRSAADGWNRNGSITPSRNLISKSICLLRSMPKPWAGNSLPRSPKTGRPNSKNRQK